MASRMEKFHSNDNNKASRSNRNKNLYNTMYSLDKYSNIEGIASLDNTREIDITKVKEMLENREKVQGYREYRKLSRDTEDDIPIVRKRYKEDMNRNYDIMDVLKEAKEKKEPDNRERVLNSTNYDILKKLNLKSKSKIDDEEKEELKDIIETISNTSMLNKINDEDLAMSMFEDLSADDTQVRNVNDLKEFIDKNEETMDDSFFTHSVKIKKADFVGGPKRDSGFKTFIVVFAILVVIASLIILGFYYFN